jgi:hypothetical protein
MKANERKALLEAMQARFERHPERHPGVAWADIAKRLEGNSAALKALQGMEATGGEPDVIGYDKKSGRVTFCDCAPESPTGRRSTCFDREARVTRKEAAPANSALEMAEEIGITMLTEAEYRALQELGEFDLKTSSWVQTPAGIRAKGGALFCDRRYGTVFVYHNGAQSYYAARGFRGLLRV